MKRIVLSALGLMLMVGSASAQRLTDQERRELESKLEALRQEMRELEQRLGRTALLRALPSPAPLAFSVNYGRPRLGVTVRTEPDFASDSLGAVLQAVTPGGPADQAGLQSGDIVVRFNDESLARRGDSRSSPGNRLIELARELDDGDTVRVQYRRGRETKNATIVARNLADQAYAYTFRFPDSAMTRAQELTGRLRAMPEFSGRFDPQVWVGFGQRWSDMELTTLDADLGAYFGTTEGLLVVRAPKDSLLALKSGDVILRIGGRVPTSPSHVVRILRSYEPGDEIRVEIMRNRRRTEVTATVPQRERGLFWEERF